MAASLEFVVANGEHFGNLLVVGSLAKGGKRA